MKIRTLTKEEVTFSISIQQDDCPVRGNVLSFGDDAEDRACEDEILARLRNGDVWAWADVKVSATWGDFEGVDYLGCCSYESEADFKAAGGYYPDMCKRALDDLNRQIRDIAASLPLEGDE